MASAQGVPGSKGSPDGGPGGVNGPRKVTWWTPLWGVYCEPKLPAKKKKDYNTTVISYLLTSINRPLMYHKG